jgi:hypothetical protein
MTHPVSNQLSQKYDHPDFRHIFQDKIEFDRVFSEHLHREWMVVEAGNAAEVRAFAERWEVARLLDAGGKSYREIAAEAQASPTTVVRVARFLREMPHQGYRLVLDRLKS